MLDEAAVTNGDSGMELRGRCHAWADPLMNAIDL